VEEATFEGDFTPDADTLNPALLSDDGSDFSIGPDAAHMTKIWSGRDKPQALEDLPNSLHLIPITLSPGTHTVEIDYSNIIYGAPDPTTGQPVDIDGCTLFVYGSAPTPAVNATSGLTGGVIRACAGGVADSAHEATVTLNATLNGANASGLTLTVAFDSSIDYTGCQAPQLLDDQNQNKLVTTLTRTTDASGNVTVTVLSSNLISKPNLTVTYQGNQVGSVGCDFASETSKRRFPAPDEVDDPNWQSNDTGWLCDANQLDNVGSQTPAKVYVKFMKDPSQGDVDGNWYFVNNHNVHLRISSITLSDDTTKITDPAQMDQYVGFVGADGSLQNSVPATTQSDGAAQATIQAGPMINDVDEIDFAVDDRTQLTH